MSGAAEQTKDECSKTFQHNHSTESDQEGHEDHDDEMKSDDVFFEDISSSLINIRQDVVKVSPDSKQVSSSNPSKINAPICVPDLDFNSHFANSHSEERSHKTEQNEVINLPNQHGRSSWRVITVRNEDTIQEITQEDGRNESRNFPADFHFESHNHRKHITTTRRVYQYSQNSNSSTTTPARIAVSESSVISSDSRMSISVFENGNSELEHDPGSVLDEEELVTSESERFFID